MNYTHNSTRHSRHPIGTAASDTRLARGANAWAAAPLLLPEPS